MLPWVAGMKSLQGKRSLVFSGCKWVSCARMLTWREFGEVLKHRGHYPFGYPNHIEIYEHEDE
jgi:hypothetical protein